MQHNTFSRPPAAPFDPDELRDATANVAETLITLHTSRDLLTARQREFVDDVIGQVQETGCCSPKQFTWMARYAAEVDTTELSLGDGSWGPTVAMLQLAHGVLKRPKMRFTIDSLGNEVALLLEQGEPRAVFTNAYARSNWHSHWTYGYLNLKASTLAVRTRSLDRPEWPTVAEFLRLLYRDPIQAAKASAALTGRCVYCNSELTDDRSKTVGYGPVCAKHYGLPWGEDGQATPARTMTMAELLGPKGPVGKQLADMNGGDTL